MLRISGLSVSYGGLRALVACSAWLGLATISDSFLYLVLQRRALVAPSAVPLLFVATPAVV